MAVFLAITDPAYIGLVNDLVHDSDLDVDTVSFNPAAGELTIPFIREESEKQLTFRLFRQSTAPRVQAYLRIRSASDYSIVDSERIGTYPINVLVYESDSTRIVIRTSIPLAFEVSVESCDIQVEVTEELVTVD